MYHIKELAITYVPSGAGIGIWLGNINSTIGIIAGLGGLVYLGIRIAIAWKEYKSKP